MKSRESRPEVRPVAVLLDSTVSLRPFISSPGSGMDRLDRSRVGEWNLHTAALGSLLEM